MASAQLVPTSTPHLSGCGWRVGVGERGAGTLLGPEGPDAASAAFRGGGGGVIPLGPSDSCAVWWVGLGGTARTLRTTQWTRASSR